MQVPTDTPPGNNAPHAERTAELLRPSASRREAPGARGGGQGYGLKSITNLIVRRRYGDGPHDRAQRARRRGAARRRLDARSLRRRDRRRQALRPRVGGEQERLRDLHLRAARARIAAARTLQRRVELHFTYDEEFGGELGPGWLLNHGLTQARPADRRRLQLPGGDRAQRLPADGGHGARQDGAMRPIPTPASMRCRPPTQILNALYAQNDAATSRSRPRCRASPTRTSTSAASKAAPTPTSCPARWCSSSTGA